MFAKALLVVCLAFIAKAASANSNNINNSISNVNVSFNDLIDINLNLNRSLRALVVSAGDLSTSIVVNAEISILETSDEVGAAVEEIVDNTKDISSVARECISQKLSTMQSLPSVILDSIKTCVGSILNQITSAVSSALEIVNSLGKIRNEVQAEIVRCGNNFLCRTGVMARSSAKVAPLVARAVGVVGNAVKLVSTLEAQMVTCASGEVIGFGQKAAGFVGDILQCIRANQ